MFGRRRGRSRRLGEHVLCVVGAVVITLAIFLVLPVMQSIGSPAAHELLLREADTGQLPPPPPAPPEPEPDAEPPEPPPPPKLAPEAPPLDLSQLELALNPDFGDAVFADVALEVTERLVGEGDDDGLAGVFSLGELDQRPRVIFQRPPRYPTELLRVRRHGTVQVTFLIDAAGRVANAKVHSSTDPAFEQPALEAVRQWRFEPGRRNGEPVSFTMRIPITFNPS